MSNLSRESLENNSQERLRMLAKKLREETNRKQKEDEFFGYQNMSDSYHLISNDKDVKQYQRFDRRHSNSTDLDEQKNNEIPNHKPQSANFNTVADDPFDVSVEHKSQKHIEKVVKLVNARDPPNKLFESTVNLANRDAWKRRSVYMSRAQFNREPIENIDIRHSVNVAFEAPLLK